MKVKYYFWPVLLLWEFEYFILGGFWFQPRELGVWNMFGWNSDCLNFGLIILWGRKDFSNMKSLQSLFLWFDLFCFLVPRSHTTLCHVGARYDSKVITICIWKRHHWGMIIAQQSAQPLQCNHLTWNICQAAYFAPGTLQQCADI